jgi:cAMP response element-binding protein, invertebrate
MGHMIDSDGDSDLSDDDSPKKRRDLLTRRPSYRKILNDLGGGEMGKSRLITTRVVFPLML